VSGNWRVTFKFEGEDAKDVDYLDYHWIAKGAIMIMRKPTHPGEILLEDVIKPLGLTVTQAAKNLGVSRKTLSELVNQKATLSPEMALRIAKATNTSPESWLNMQTKLNL
jgi:addiction module HigA family antidote